MGVREPAELNVVVGVKVLAGVKTGVENEEPMSGSMDEVGTTWADAPPPPMRSDTVSVSASVKRDIVVVECGILRQQKEAGTNEKMLGWLADYNWDDQSTTLLYSTLLYSTPGLLNSPTGRTTTTRSSSSVASSGSFYPANDVLQKH